jgi:hypothetical protein
MVANVPPLSIPVPAGTTMQLPKPQGTGQRIADRCASNLPHPSASECRREQPPHFPLALAFTSLHQPPRTPDAQTGQWHPTSGHYLSHTPQHFCPAVETIALDLGGNELTDEENELWEDPMDVLNHCEDTIWDTCPCTNNALHLKVRKVVHSQTREVLTLLKKKVNLSSSEYKTMYLNVFGALISKHIAAKKSDLQASMPSVMNIKSFMGSNPFLTPQVSKWEPEEPGMPLPPWDWTPHLTCDPVVEDTMAQINAPQ